MRMTDAELVSEFFVHVLAKLPHTGTTERDAQADTFYSTPEFANATVLADCSEWRSDFVDVIQRKLGQLTPYQASLIETMLERFAPLNVETKISPFHYTFS